MVATPRRVAERIVPATSAASGARATGSEGGDRVVVEAGDLRLQFDRATGQLARVERGGATLSLTNGPRLVGGDARPATLTHRAEGSDYLIEARYEGPLRYVRWRVRADGWVALDYRYELNGELDNAGITFDYPEGQVTGLRWLGKGPYRVWKNRLEGVEYDVWRKPYNDAVTGLAWQYPEFKGYHAGLHWAVLETREMPLTVVTPEEDLFLRVLTPRLPPRDDRRMTPTNSYVEFPAGAVSFLHAIGAIGNKFQPADRVSPSGRKSVLQSSARNADVVDYTATVYFHFGALRR